AADHHEAGVTDRELAAEAVDDVERHREHDRDPDVEHHLRGERAQRRRDDLLEEPREPDTGDEWPQRAQPGDRSSGPVLADTFGEALHTPSTPARPKMPVGLPSSTTIRTVNT